MSSAQAEATVLTEAAVEPDVPLGGADAVVRAWRRFGIAWLSVALIRLAWLVMSERGELLEFGRAMLDPRGAGARYDWPIGPEDASRVLWPAALAVMIAVRRWTTLRWAAVLTLTALVLERIGILIIDLDPSSGLKVRPILRVAMALGTPPNTASIARAAAIILGALAIDFGLLVQASRLTRRIGRQRLNHAMPRASWPTVGGRMSLLISTIMAFGLVGNVLWRGFVEVMGMPPGMRKLILANSPPAPNRPGYLRGGPMRVYQPLSLLNEAARLHQEGKYEEARRTYRDAAQRVRASRESDGGYGRVPVASVAMAANNLAWRLATGPVEGRSAEDAVSLARLSVDLVSDDGTTWNTLGVAHYRKESYRAAETGLAKSMELREGGDAFDWYFLAMIGAKRGEREKARAMYDRAVAWNRANRPGDVELRAFRTEAAELLGIDPKTFEPPGSDTIRGGVRRSRPMGPVLPD